MLLDCPERRKKYRIEAKLIISSARS